MGYENRTNVDNAQYIPELYIRFQPLSQLMHPSAESEFNKCVEKLKRC